MSLSENLQRLRKEKGLSQEDVARELFVSRQSVSKWENGNAEPGVKDLAVLADLFGVTLDELVGREWPEQLAVPTLPEGAAAVARRAERDYLCLTFLRLAWCIFVSTLTVARYHNIGPIGIPLDLVVLLAGIWNTASYMWRAILYMGGVNLVFCVVSAFMTRNLGVIVLSVVPNIIMAVVCLVVLTRPSIKTRFHRT